MTENQLLNVDIFSLGNILPLSPKIKCYAKYYVKYPKILCIMQEKLAIGTTTLQ